MEVGDGVSVPGLGAPRQYRLGRGSVSGTGPRALLPSDARLPPRTLASRIARRENAGLRRPHPRTARRRDAVRARRARERAARPRAAAGSARACCCARSAGAGASAGWTPFAVDARDLAPGARRDRGRPRRRLGRRAPARPARHLRAHERARRLPARARCCPRCPARAVIVVASRDAPEPGWFEGGWETVALELAARAALRARVATCCSRGTGSAATARGRRSRAGRAGCRWRCGSARPRRGPTPAGLPGEPAAPLRRIPSRAGAVRRRLALDCIARASSSRSR